MRQNMQNLLSAARVVDHKRKLARIISELEAMRPDFDADASSEIYLAIVHAKAVADHGRAFVAPVKVAAPFDTGF